MPRSRFNEQQVIVILKAVEKPAEVAAGETNS